ncbi:MAG: hypothetical protein AAGJ40_09710 [Planctomycetota bacterium]
MPSSHYRTYRGGSGGGGGGLDATAVNALIALQVPTLSAGQVIVGSPTGNTVATIPNGNVVIGDTAETTGINFTDSIGSNSTWTTLTSANNGDSVAPGRYQIEADASFAFGLAYAAGAEWLINGRGDEDDNNVSIGAASDAFTYHNVATNTEVSVAGPFVMDETIGIRLIASPAVANQYRITTETGFTGVSSSGSTLPADASGFLQNDGSGNLSWATSTGQPQYNHDQSVAATVWSVPHGLNTLTPTVHVFVDGAGEVNASIAIVDSNNISVDLTPLGPVTGDVTVEI